MFDEYACWPDGQPNSTVKVPCPWYLPWNNQVQDGFALRECGSDGQWATSNSSPTWRDPSQCSYDNGQREAQEKQMMIFAYFTAMYTVGYCVSLAGLSLALIILLVFRKLHCTRNYIHTHLFASFILRAVSILTRDSLLSREIPEFRDNRELPKVLSDQVNFFIFIRIIQVLVSKLKAHQMRYTDYKFRLAKSTLTLIPLLGIHEVVFAALPDEHMSGVLRNINLFFQLFFNSFQGFLVAILYCFINKEVQAEITKKWHRWKLGVIGLDDLRNNGSNTPQVGASVPLSTQCHRPSSCLPSPHCPEDHRISSTLLRSQRPLPHPLKHPPPGPAGSQTAVDIIQYL
ncbi:Glucagon receptor [Channa argus]|uniref:Glucagon receptor n=1 Tax=Channa argus TaxID=215402 RepID=A0A6G1PSY7_CHAAH|nr:Glucagon receptor [Channa argus]